VSGLAATQRDFIDALYSESPCAPGVAVYRRNMVANLGGALAATFPVVERLVGGAFFREAARRFLLDHPSRSGDLNDFGEGFAEFLAGYPHAKPLAYLADVARLEWACHESYQAADGGGLDIAALAGVAPEAYPRIRFSLDPAVRLVRSEHPVEAIWNANQGERDGTPDRDTGPDFVLVRRAQATVHVSAIDEAEWRFLEALAKGFTLDEASASMGEEFAARFLAEGLARYVAEGVIAGFTVAEESA